MNTRRKLVSIVLGTSLAIIAPAAATADSMISSTLTVSNQGTGNFGSILIQDTGANTVQVTVTLTTGEFYAATGAGDDSLFDFNDILVPVTLGTVTFQQSPGGQNPGTFSLISPDPFNGGLPAGKPDFTYGLQCSNCNGASNDITSLTFTLTGTGLIASDFEQTDSATHTYDFGADILSPSFPGGTAPVAATSFSVVTPEPSYAGLLLALAALLSLGYARRRRAAAR